MCLIAFAWRAHPGYDLVVAANRDEFHQRPTSPAGFWPDAPDVLAGRDDSAGGTWCGVDRGGRFAAVTNVREPDPPRAGQLSRGALVADYLTGNASAAAFCESVHARRYEFGAFNLLVADREGLYYLGNRDHRGVVALPPGIYGLSNGILGDAWPKTERAREELRSLMRAETISPAPLLTLLADDTPAPDTALPDTGVGLGTERLLSPIFIRGRRYGTRASTVVLRGGRTLRFVERGFGPEGRTLHTVDETLELGEA